jgi:hypothetical protein
MKDPLNQSFHFESYFEGPMAVKHTKWKSILEDSATSRGDAIEYFHVACRVLDDRMG